MGKYNGAVVTTAGQNVIAQAITGTKLTWTVMRTSSVAIPQGTDLTTLTSLSGIEQTSKITDASVYGNNVIQLSSRFSNTGIATVYYIQTVGIYGQLAGGAETLIAVMTAVTPDEMPVYDPDSPSAFIFNTQITVQNADAVTMTVNDTGTATVADLNRKVDINGGDVSDTVVNTVTASTAEYPVPSAGDSAKTIIGKITKFCADIVKTFTGATSSAVGKKGLVPAPSAGQQTAYMRGDGTWQTAQNNATTTEAGYVLDARMGKTLNDAIVVRNSGFVFGVPSIGGVTVPATGAWTNVMSVRPTGGAGVYLFNVHLNAKTQSDTFTGVRIYFESTGITHGAVTLNEDRTYHDTRIDPLTAEDVTGRIFVQVSCVKACTFERTGDKNLLSILRLY